MLAITGNSRLAWRTFRCLLFCLCGVWLPVLIGCPSQPAPASRTAAPEELEPQIQPRDLLGAWSGQAWQVVPAGPWRDAEAAGFSAAMADASSEDAQSVEPVSDERLAEFPSVNVEITVTDEQLVMPGIEGALVRIDYREPGAAESDQSPQAVLFQRDADGTLVLDCGRDRLRVVSVDSDRIECDGRLRDASVSGLVLTRRPDALDE